MKLWFIHYHRARCLGYKDRKVLSLPSRFQTGWSSQEPWKFTRSNATGAAAAVCTGYSQAHSGEWSLLCWMRTAEKRLQSWGLNWAEVSKWADGGGRLRAERTAVLVGSSALWPQLLCVKKAIITIWLCLLLPQQSIYCTRTNKETNPSIVYCLVLVTVVKKDLWYMNKSRTYHISTSFNQIMKYSLCTVHWGATQGGMTFSVLTRSWLQRSDNWGLHSALQLTCILTCSSNSPGVITSF